MPRFHRWTRGAKCRPRREPTPMGCTSSIGRQLSLFVTPILLTGCQPIPNDVARRDAASEILDGGADPLPSWNEGASKYKAAKPVGIQQTIGQRPIAAFGNSDGDFEMLEWSTSGAGKRFGLVVHHTDGEREWAYDRDSQIGRLSRALDEAPKRGWVVVDMKRDWKTIFPFRNLQ
jgi:hypothetical protein